MVNDDQRDLLSEPVENFEQFLSDGRRKSLERLIKREHLHVAGAVLPTPRSVRRLATAPASQGRQYIPRSCHRTQLQGLRAAGLVDHRRFHRRHDAFTSKKIGLTAL